MSHTPGPWRLEDIDVFDKNEELLASVYPMKHDGLFESWKANARLVAAAPEMLEALKAVDKVVGSREMEQWFPAWTRLKMQDAIRKAEEGES